MTPGTVAKSNPYTSPVVEMGVPPIRSIHNKSEIAATRFTFPK